MSHSSGVVFQPHSKLTGVVAPPEKLIPMVNFSMVCPGVYRGGYPTKKNFPFLQALHLRSILYLCPEDYAESNLKFCEENGIAVLRFPTEGNKEPFCDIAEALMHRVLGAICDTRSLPLLIHCNKGKHRTGTVVAALRMQQGWSLVSALDEYKRFAGDKARFGDQQYVELYHAVLRLTPPFVPAWFVRSARATVVYSERELLEVEARMVTQSPFSTITPAAFGGGKLGGGLTAPPRPSVTGGPNEDAEAETGGVVLNSILPSPSEAAASAAPSLA
ncbi:unnamed protein product [Phytomonas sp. Hart1]|nr:unnamed protein product [Phytomonas sp. Hart1]|eukprot:CCW67558.1 unnamed protein product [Phytomonas sp. isolate Hart1]